MAITHVVEPLGLVVLGNKPWYGASPDGAINCSCCGYGVLEVKCPYSLREKTLQKEIESGSFYVVKDEQSFALRRDHNYFFQIQHEMSVTGTDYCDFVVWSPEESLIIRINKDVDFIDCMYEKCDKFWKNFILPKLLTNQIENEDPISKDCPTKVNIKYCTPNCERLEENDGMVGCDCCDNWFHPVCLGLKRLPSNKTWYCRTCRKQTTKETENILIFKHILFLLSFAFLGYLLFYTLFTLLDIIIYKNLN